MIKSDAPDCFPADEATAYIEAIAKPIVMQKEGRSHTLVWSRLSLEQMYKIIDYFEPDGTKCLFALRTDPIPGMSGTSCAVVGIIHNTIWDGWCRLIFELPEPLFAQLRAVYPEITSSITPNAELFFNFVKKKLSKSRMNALNKVVSANAIAKGSNGFKHGNINSQITTGELAIGAKSSTVGVFTLTNAMIEDVFYFIDGYAIKHEIPFEELTQFFAFGTDTFKEFILAVELHFKWFDYTQASCVIEVLNTYIEKVIAEVEEL